MFQVNDYVVYGLTGVCQIINITKEKYKNTDETEYYVLNPVYNHTMTIMVPVGKPGIAMRAISTRGEILSLIAAMPGMETAWIEDERQRNMYFKTALKSGNNEEWAKMIRILYLERQARKDAGKKLTKTDEDLLNSAEKQLNQEFAIALNIEPDEVVPYIMGQLSKMGVA